MCVDGVNPFSVQRVSYSMWPIMLTILNLPRHVRNTFSNFALAGIIPSNGTGEPKHIAPFLDIIVDELLLLSSLSMYDAYRDAPFSFKALNYVLDYPGLAKVFSMTGSGSYSGCAWCSLRGTDLVAIHLFLNSLVVIVQGVEGGLTGS